MNKFFVFVATLALLLVIAFASVYWNVRSIDPEGACKDLRNFSLCADAWFNHNYDGAFHKLPTDQEMIDNFKEYRTDFEGILNKLQRGYVSLDILSTESIRSGIYASYRLMPWTPNVYSSPHFEDPASNREWSWQFHVDSTLYIEGAEEHWPWVNRLKGYAYFPLPVPQIAQGRLIGPVLKNGQPFSWRVLDQLDGNWPADWAHDECLLRRIEAQWFLFLCKDHVGG